MNYLAWWLGSMYGMAQDPVNWLIILLASAALKSKNAIVLVPAILVGYYAIAMYFIIIPQNDRAGLLFDAERIFWHAIPWFSLQLIGMGIWLSVSAALDRLLKPQT